MTRFTDDDVQGCYRAYDADGELLYVGSSIHVKARLREHSYQELGRRWLPFAARITVTVYTEEQVRSRDYESPVSEERTAIHTEDPIFNTFDNPRTALLSGFVQVQYKESHAAQYALGVPDVSTIPITYTPARPTTT